MMIKKEDKSYLFSLIYGLLFLFILFDVGYSFVQHLQKPLDGDMADCILPSKEYQKIFHDPLGISVITQDASYPNPNRFFCYYVFSKYFKSIPIFLQNFTTPIESIYYASALAKILIQISILLLLGFFITGKRNIFNKDFMIAVALITPLFQTNGYRSYMGIIDPSITYTFSYALPCMWLLLFYLPFYHSYINEKKFSPNIFIIVFLIGIAVFITLNGPLNPGVIIIISLLYILHHFKLNYSKSLNTSTTQRVLNALKNIPKTHFFFFSLAGILSLYSLYLGSKSSLYLDIKIPISQRYMRLPEGIYFLISQKIGYPLLLIMIGINAFFIYKFNKTIEGLKILNLLKWIGIFSLFYIILLPLGGYRPYRPDIIRYDSIMPITLALIFIYGLSTIFLIRNIKNKGSYVYLIIVVAFSMIYTLSDKLEPGRNVCEKEALTQIANSKEDTVLLNNDCSVIAWEKITDPNESERNAELLQLWRITNGIKLYYQPSEKKE
jgi:hypothetical protein